MSLPVARPAGVDQTIRLIAPVAAALVAIALSMLAVAAAGKSPVAAIDALATGAFGSLQAATATLSRTVPLVLVALGWIVAFSTRRVSIGFEGQILAGGAAAAVVGIEFSLPAPVHLSAAVLAGALGGALWVAPPALMWARRGAPEIITTLLMNLIAIELISWLVRGPLQEERHVFARTDPIHASALWPKLIDGSRLHWDIVAALAIMAVVALVVRRTAIGLRLRFVGANPTAARYQGIDPIRVSTLALLASGGLAGIAGSSLVLAQPTATMSPNFSAGYGFEGIVVALLVRNNPIAVVPAALLFAALRQGSGLLEARVGVSSAVIVLTLGTIVILMSAAGPVLARLGNRGTTSEGGP